jgi:hypothetical protein
MLWGHLYLRQIHLAPRLAKKEMIREAVKHIALALKYDHALGGHSLATTRAEANLHDWLMRHGLEMLNGETILDAFTKEVETLKETSYPEEAKCRLWKFIQERFGT